MLRAWHKASNKDTVAVLEALGTTAAAQDEDSGGNPMHGDRDSRRRRAAPAQRPVTRSGGVWLPTNSTGPSRPTAERGGAPARPNSVFGRLGLLPRDTTMHTPAQAGIHAKDA